MGNLECCRKTENDEKNNEREIDHPKINLNLKDMVFSADDFIKKLFTSGSSNFNENNQEPLQKEVNLEKIKKIQRNYRSYRLKNRFEELKPIISQKSTNFIEQLYKKCEQGGEVPSDSSFSEDGWKKFYPPDDRFFLYQKGKVFKKEIRIKNSNIDELDNVEIYEGEINSDNKKHGFGILTTPYYILKGSWRNGEFTGWGRKSMRNGDVFEGKFINGELNGKGIFKNKEGTYVGEFVNSMREGKGELNTEFYHYSGDFKNDKLHGNGTIDFLIDGHRYEGQFQNNSITGKGIYKWKNGDIYDGEMKNGKMNGYGKYTFEDGKIYEGEYVEGVKQGKGKIIYPTNIKFEGTFMNGVPHGEGIITKNDKETKVLYNNGELVKILE